MSQKYSDGPMGANFSSPYPSREYSIALASTGKPGFRGLNNLSLMIRITSLILKTAADKWLALVCLLRSIHKETSRVPLYLPDPAVIIGPAEIVCMIPHIRLSPTNRFGDIDAIAMGGHKLTCHWLHT
jgi:hypothetical protein